jgi:PAS domain S-box-containing protein
MLDDNHLQEVVDGIDAAVYAIDLNGWVTFVNRRAVDLFGYPEQRWLSQPGFCQTIAHKEDRPLVWAHFHSCASERAAKQLEYRIVAADGRVSWVRETLAPMRNGSGAVDSLLGVIWKIDHSTKVQRELDSMRRRLADELMDLSHLHELSQRLWATPQMEPLLEEILLATVSIQGADMGMVRLHDPVRGDLRIVASLGFPPLYLERYGRVPVGDVACGLAITQGRPLIIEDVETEFLPAAYREPARLAGYRAKYSTLLTTRSGEMLGTIATCFRKQHRPVDREIRLSELFARQAADFVENARLREALADAGRRKDEALAAMAHELRNPLNVIMNVGQILRNDAGQGSRTAELADLIVRQSALMGRLAKELIEVSDASPAQSSLRREELELRAVLCKAAESVTFIAKDRQHDLNVVPPPDPVFVDADPLRLEQILVNLLINACQYTEPGGRITLDAWQEGATAVIRVRDTGIGIPPELLPRIFEPFVRAADSKRRAATGLGLGLALVKRFAERHGGSVTAASEGHGKGSEFVVRLPGACQRPDPPALGRDRTLPFPTQDTLSTKLRRDPRSSAPPPRSSLTNQKRG